MLPSFIGLLYFRGSILKNSFSNEKEALCITGEDASSLLDALNSNYTVSVTVTTSLNAHKMCYITVNK